jgi:hypothetical protein
MVEPRMSKKERVRIGRAPFAAAGVHVEGEEGVPVLGLDLLAAKRPHAQPLPAHRLALLADRLALARRQRRQEIVEAAVAVVVPVVLPAEPQEPAMLAEALPVGLGAIGGVDRADVIVASDLGQHVDQGVAYAGSVGTGSHEQARARNRRERHGDLQLGIIPSARALQGLRPAMVEDVFALAVTFQIERSGAQQGSILGLGQKVLRLPAGAPADRLGILQCLQEPVAEKGIAGRARRQCTGVPLVGIDRRKRLDNAQADGRRSIWHGASIARNVP